MTKSDQEVGVSVQLLAHTPDPELVCAAAARLCYSDSKIMDLVDKFKDGSYVKLLEKIMELGHYSVLEHASFQFGVEGISRACSHQLVRHRLASYSQQSQRYVEANAEFARIVPETIKAKAELYQRYNALMAEIGSVYHELVEGGVPAEDARFVLPNAAETKIVITMNARELIQSFFTHRGCRRAQWEIQEMARQMLLLAKPVAPIIFAKAGPGCVTGPCPEGKMTCGHAKEVREQFLSM